MQLFLVLFVGLATGRTFDAGYLWVLSLYPIASQLKNP